MRSRRSVAKIDVGGDLGSLAITFTQMPGKRLCLGFLDYVHSAAAKSSAGKARADAAGFFRGQIDENVDLRATGLEIVSISGVGRIHQPAERLEIAGFQRIGRSNRAFVLRNNVTAALENLRPHLIAPTLEVVDRGIAQPLDLRTMASEQLRAFFHFGAAGVVLTPRVGMLHHSVGNHDTEIRRNWGQAVLKGPAIEQQSVVFGAATSDELVHDTGGSADEVILRALAELGYFRRSEPRASDAQNGDHAGHFDGRRGTESRAQRHVAVEGEAEAGDLHSRFAKDRDDTERVVAPVTRSLLGEAVERVCYLIVEIRGIDSNALVVAGANCGQGRKVDRRRHDKALGVIGVLADQIDAAGCDKKGGVLPKSL